MRYSKLIYSVKAFFHNVISIQGFSALFSPFGFGITVSKGIETFFGNTELPKILESFLHDYWWVFLAIGFLIAIYTCLPKLLISSKLNGRDIIIELAIGDLFSFEGDIVIGSNTTFDTQISDQLISKNSVQGKFTENYYNGTAQLDKELIVGLDSIKPEKLTGQRVGKNERYPIGTVVKLSPKNRTGYFLAIADINEHGNAYGTFEGLKDALVRLWVFIGERGSKDRPIVMPVLGTGATRLTPPRQKIVQEIIKSFVAACSENTFCEKLIIVLYDKDVLNHKIDFDSLGNYLQHICAYTEFVSNSSERLGTPTL